MEASFVLLTGFLIALLGSLVQAQEIRTCSEDVSYWIFSKDASTYLIKLKGKVRKSQNPKVICVRDYMLQYVVVYKQNYMKDVPPKDTASFMPLIQYATSEGENMSVEFHTKLELVLDNKSVGKTKILLCYFKMPSNVSLKVKHQLFANVIISDNIVGLSSSQFSYQNLEDVKRFLIDQIKTLKELKGEIKVNELCAHSYLNI